MWLSVLQHEHKLMHFLMLLLPLAGVIMANLVFVRTIIQITMVLLCSIQTVTILKQYVIHQSSHAQPGAQAARRKSAASLSFSSVFR